MFLLRRAAVRALSQPATRQLSTLRPSSTRATLLQPTKPSISIRSFHQSRIWLAEEQERKPEEVQSESAAAAELAEEASEAAQEAAEQAVAESASTSTPEAEPAVQQAQEVAEGESSIAAEAAETAAAAASSAQSTTRRSSPPRFPDPDAPSASTDFSTPQPSRILYIGNLFFEVTASQLEAEFGRFGAITNSRIVTDPRGLSKGFGYIEFAEQSGADQAVRELDQRVFQGRRMAVQYHVKRERKPGFGGGQGRDRATTANTPSKTLFIGNMSYQMSDKDLNDLFREIRDVLDVRVAIDRRSGQPRGFAHADFIDIPSAQRAKEHLENKVIYGRQLRVDFSMSSSGVKSS